ncbi:MAG: amino acid permease, partial [Planctomycetes bacterium]|nr:amino acid permease [Planctomycetota bacterium]
MNAPKSELSAFDLGCVVVGGIIGVGIFFTPQQVAIAVDTPGMVLLAWGLGGLLAVLGAIVFAELSQLVPGHGGMFRYLERAFGRRLAFLYGWSNWLVIQAGAAGIVALILCDYLEQAIAPAAPWSDAAKVLASGALILTFTAINVIGLRIGKRVQNALTVFKVLALAFLVALAWAQPGGAAPEPLPEPSGRP